MEVGSEVVAVTAAVAARGPGTPSTSSELGIRLAELERHRSADVELRLRGALQAEVDARAAGLDTEMMRARLVSADMLVRRGDGARGAELAVEVNAWALAQGPRSLKSRSHLVLSSLFESTGDMASALDHAVRALELLDASTSGGDRGNALLRLADACALIGDVDEARRRYGEAGEVFASLADEDYQLIVLNNLAVLEYESGNVTAALAAAERLVRACGPDGLHPSYADTIARARLAAGDLDAAEEMVRLGFELWRARGDAQAVTPAELALTYVEILLARQRVEDAAAQLDWCLRVCDDRDLRGARVQALELQAAVLAARADHRGAYQAHRAFHREFVAVRSHQQEAAARTRRALAETAEARAEARRFWEQARTDPLTALFNRRFVDEELPGLLDRAGRDGEFLVAAVLDVDHFKRINDRFSHAVGDEVLSRLGQRFAAAVPGGAVRVGTGWPTGEGAPQPRGFAARLGGEEFLIVQTCGAVPDVLARMEQLRTELQRQDWRDVAPALTVTISIGVAVATAADTRTSLLGRADDNLYRAKQQGRNRIVTDLSEPAAAPGPGRCG